MCLWGCQWEAETPSHSPRATLDYVKALVVVDAAPQNMQQGTQNIRSFVQQDDELDSVDAFVERVLQYNPRRDPQQVRGSIMHNIKELPSGKWTWKYDRALRSPGRRMGSDAETEKRLWAISSRCNARRCWFAAARATSSQ